ncbi:MAG: dihydrofolate reductase family protein [Solirubrobacterales bacterium]|nr:dihydrofolate reductase family protein [Solirubrobacterales bacterium]
MVANFVASIDGRASFQGRSSALGDEGDLAMFHTLRREVDCVLVGTGTLQVEHFGRLIRDAPSRERRARRGLSPEPLTATLTRSGRVPWQAPMFAEPEARIVVYSGAEVDAPGVAAQVDVVRMDAAQLSFAAALADLRARLGIATVLCEGGPRVLGRLVLERRLDELFLTLTPHMTGGGDAPALTSGPELPDLAAFELAGLLERADSLFLRYRTRT